MALTSTGRALWRGDLMSGSGTASLDSGAGGPFDVTWEARTEEHGGKTSPEELIAAAHAACFSMALSHGLASEGHTPTELSTEAIATFDRTDEGMRITSMAIRVRGSVPGLDREGFVAAAEDAKANCPVSKALEGNVPITVDADLA